MVGGGRGEKCLHGVMEPSLLRVVSQCSGVRGALTVFFFFFFLGRRRASEGLESGQGSY